MNLNTRAAELKAKLLRGRQGSTPPVAAMASKVENNILSSPGTPLVGGGNADLVDDLIQQYAPPTEQNTNIQGQKTNGSSSIKSIEQPKHLKTTALGSPTLVTKSERQNGTSVGKSLQKKRPSNDSMSEVSEGEIIEDASIIPEKSTPSEPKNPQPPLKTNEKDTFVRRGTGDEEAARSLRRTSQEEFPSATQSVSTTRPQGRRVREDSRDDEQRDNRRRYSTELNDRRPSIPDNRTDSYAYSSRRGSRDQNDIDSRIEVKKDFKRDETKSSLHESKQQEIRKPVVRETKPSLEQVLPHDPDLREWLEITGYHNRDYRDKILIRRRKIAALDAQKAQLLLEMDVEERGGLPAVGGASSLTPAMAPPPAPTTISRRPDIIQSEPESGLERSRVISNKRAYSPPERVESGNLKKIARIEERRIDDRRDSRPRIKDEDEPISLRSSGYGSYRGDRRDEREYDGMCSALFRDRIIGYRLQACGVLVRLTKNRSCT